METKKELVASELGELIERANGGDLMGALCTAYEWGRTDRETGEELEAQTAVKRAESLLELLIDRYGFNLTAPEEELLLALRLDWERVGNALDLVCDELRRAADLLAEDPAKETKA